jgi:hypothetical protein
MEHDFGMKVFLFTAMTTTKAITSAIAENHEYRLESSITDPDFLILWNLDSVGFSLHRKPTASGKVAVVLSQNEQSTLTFETHPHPLTLGGPLAAFSAYDSTDEWKIQMCTELPPNAPKIRDKNILATISLYKDGVLFGLYVIIDE